MAAISYKQCAPTELKYRITVIFHKQGALHETEGLKYKMLALFTNKSPFQKTERLVTGFLYNPRKSAHLRRLMQDYGNFVPTGRPFRKMEGLKTIYSNDLLQENCHHNLSILI